MARTSPNMMIERADEFRRLAMQNRNKGRHVGASAKGWNYSRPELSRDDWHDAFRMAWDGWRMACREANNDYAAAMLNGPGWEDDCAIPF